MIYKKEQLPLSIDGQKLYLARNILEEIKNELETFLEDNKYMNNRDFSKNVLFSYEIKANNTIEGYNDDISIVDDVLTNSVSFGDKQKSQRIKNLYSGYKYIFEGNEINKENLKTLYSLLSKNLLSSYDKSNMGEFYRNDAVYIFFNNNPNIEPSTGVPFNEIENYMNELFNFINTNNNFDTMTDYFIKSQILHFQFVNIHPYFDINGRTARTTSLWYLLNNKVYPYIIFNRAISLNKSKYYKVIREVKFHHNVTYFINYILETVKLELEKECIIGMVESSTQRLSNLDYQTIYYILSMNGLLTVKDFASFYNKYNDKKSLIKIYENMILPLIDKNIIVKLRDTESNISNNQKNFVFELNKKNYELDRNKIKRLTLM